MTKLSTTSALSMMFALPLLLAGCQSQSIMSAPQNIVQNNTDQNSINQNNSGIDTAVINQQTLEQQALHIQQALANGDYASSANDIHPTRGVRFSMYAYIRPESDKVFSRAQYLQYLHESNIRFTWGEKDGIGDLLVTPLPDYLRTWVNASAFNDNPTITLNNSQAMGNSIDNLNKIYQNSDFVEFYSSGSEEYGGMDWRAMRLVFDSYQGKRYLVAIISDQWTI